MIVMSFYRLSASTLYYWHLSSDEDNADEDGADEDDNDGLNCILFAAYSRK